MFETLKTLFGSGNSKLKGAIKDGATLIDVRTPSEFATGSVKGAINIPLDRMEKELSGLNKQKTLIVFCRSGARSAMAKSILESKGITSVINGGTWQHVNQAKADKDY